jgi:cytochrome c-type biogenesis protein CcmH
MALGLVLLAGSAGALEPEERLSNPADEARARALTRELRCLVCKGQTVDDSNAPIARALRLLVRDRIAAGDDDAAVLAAVTQRYGDEVRLRPAWKADTVLLWLAPVMILALGGGAAARFVLRSNAMPAPEPLSTEEREALDRQTHL